MNGEGKGQQVSSPRAATRHLCGVAKSTRPPPNATPTQMQAVRLYLWETTKAIRFYDFTGLLVNTYLCALNTLCLFETAYKMYP